MQLSMTWERHMTWLDNGSRVGGVVKESCLEDMQKVKMICRNKRKVRTFKGECQEPEIQDKRALHDSHRGTL